MKDNTKTTMPAIFAAFMGLVVTALAVAAVGNPTECNIIITAIVAVMAAGMSSTMMKY